MIPSAPTRAKILRDEGMLMTAQKKNIVLIVVFVIGAFLVALVATCIVVVPMMLNKLTQSAFQDLQQPYPFTAMQWEDEPAATTAMADAMPAEGFWARLDGHLLGTKPDAAVSQIGMLALPTGNILVTDMNFIEENLPQRRSVQPGSYPVYSIAGRMKSAVAVLIQKDRQPTQWVVADQFREALAGPGSVSETDVSIDSGTIFVDSSMCKSQPMYDPWPMIMGKTNSVVLDPRTGANVVLAAPLGNVTVIPCWGLDAEGAPVVLMVYDGY